MRVKCIKLVGNVWQFRRRIPSDLSESYGGKTHFKRSLKTPDKKEAERLALKLLYETNEEFAAKRQLKNGFSTERPKDFHTYTPKEKSAFIAQHYLHVRLGTDARSRLEPNPELDGEFESRYGEIDFDEDGAPIVLPPAPRLENLERAGVAKQLKLIKLAISKGQADFLDSTIQLWLAFNGFPPQEDWSETDYKELQWAFLYAEKSALENIAARDRADIRPDAVVAGTPEPIAPKGLVTIGSLLRLWKNAKTRRPLTVLAFEHAVEQFIEFLKHDDAMRVRRKNMIDYRDWLLAGSGTDKRLKGAKKSESKPLPETVQKKLSFVKAVFTYAAKNEHIPENPAAGVNVELDKDRPQPRVSFEEPDLRTIFDFLDPAKPNDDGLPGAHSYWLPVLAYFSGARGEELAQAKVANVERHKTHGWFLDMRTQLPGQHFKNKGSRRLIPLHEDLVALGFPSYFESVKGEEWLFPEIVPSSKGKRLEGFSRWFSRRLRKNGITKDKTFHSFRHTWKDAADRCLIPEHSQDAICGHTDGRATRKYGTPPQHAELRTLISMLKMPFTAIPPWTYDAVSRPRPRIVRKHKRKVS
jgi:integrase